MHDFLASGKTETTDKMHFCMAGFKLKNTLSDNGGVTRGVCKEENGYLTGIHETHDIEKIDGKAAVRKDGYIRYFDDDTPVSMNMWGMSPDFIDLLDEGFRRFLTDLCPGDLKAEYLLPNIIENLLAEGRADVEVLHTDDKWFGMTYHEDIEAVQKAFKKLVKDGIYPESIL